MVKNRKTKKVEVVIVRKKTLVTFLAVMLVVLIVHTAMAEKQLTPEKLDGATIVDADWVKANLSTVTVYDVRKKAEYVDAHIPGAIYAPYREKSKKAADFDASKDKLDLGKFTADKNAPVVTQCNGERCWKSYKTAVWLVREGYKKVYWFRGGLPAWKAKGFPVD